MRTTTIRFMCYFLPIILGIVAGVFGSEEIVYIATFISYLFVSALKWLSIPMIFLSILDTTSGLQSKNELLMLGAKIFKYTLFTTFLAASIALAFFLLLQPANSELLEVSSNAVALDNSSLFSIMLLLTVSLTFATSIWILSCHPAQKKNIHHKVSRFYSKIMKLIQLILKAMPVAIWAFSVLFVHRLNGLAIQSLALYLACVVLANISQGIVVLPILLRIKHISPIKAFKGMAPALSIAFWSKSSGVALPVAIESIQSNLQVDPKVARFALPECTTINMNACAAFILITVLFVSQSHGVVFTSKELLLWVGIATVAAIGNAGVPMGCYTLSCALLSYMEVPLHLLGLILPFYTLIDMLESAINVWSDGCVTLIVNKEFKSTV